jgi:hypothetical protein
MVFRRSWISGEPSQYGAYVEKLKRAGVVYRAPWMAYLLQTALIWGTFGFVVYAACRWAVPGSWWVRTLVIYLGIGLLAAVDHVTSGKQGRAGLGVAFVAVILLWPMVLVTHWRSRR